MSHAGLTSFRTFALASIFGFESPLLERMYWSSSIGGLCDIFASIYYGMCYGRGSKSLET